MQKNSELLQVAQLVADAADAETMKWFRKPHLSADNKAKTGFDPVTQADRAAEKAMRAMIEKLRPGDGILGEEFDAKASTSGYTWVLDPIDGTRGYLAGTPTWGTLIAVGQGGAPEIGIISQPFTRERFIGADDMAFWTYAGVDQLVSVRNTQNLSDAIVFSTFPEVGTPAERDAFERVATQCQLTRFGTDCYAYGLLAAGQIDLVIEAGLQPYDIQAPQAVVSAAGGVVTTWDGGPAEQGGQIIAAATPELHAKASALLRATS